MSVCHGSDAIPICGPISVYIVSATVTLPHCEPAMLPHYYTFGQNLLFIVHREPSTEQLWVLPTCLWLSVVCILSIAMFVCLYVCLPVCLSDCLSVCLFVCLFMVHFMAISSTG